MPVLWGYSEEQTRLASEWRTVRSGRKVTNEDWFRSYAHGGALESDDCACAQAAVTRTRSGIFWRSRCRSHCSRVESGFRPLWRERVPRRFHDREICRYVEVAWRGGSPVCA